MKIKKLAATILTLGVLVGCTPPLQASLSKDNFKPASDKEFKILSENKIVSNNNQFGLKLYEQILKKEIDKNVFISPLSISFALAMTYNGSDNKTREEMAKVLQLSGIDIDEVNRT